MTLEIYWTLSNAWGTWWLFRDKRHLLYVVYYYIVNWSLFRSNCLYRWSQIRRSQIRASAIRSPTALLSSGNTFYTCSEVMENLPRDCIPITTRSLSVHPDKKNWRPNSTYTSKPPQPTRMRIKLQYTFYISIRNTTAVCQHCSMRNTIYISI